MRTTRNTIATVAALLIGALVLDPASAAVRDSYRPADKPANCFQEWSAIGRLKGDSISQATRESGLDQMVRLCRWPDDHSVTQR